jgi:hypothetical protein
MADLVAFSLGALLLVGVGYAFTAGLPPVWGYIKGMNWFDGQHDS